MKGFERFLSSEEYLTFDGDSTYILPIKNLKELYVSKDQLSTEDIVKLGKMGVDIIFVD